MRMIKVGDKYLGLVDRRGDALRFSSDAAQTRTIAESITAGEYMGGLNGYRVVKLKTIADRTADSMRGLADDVEGDSEPDPEREGQDRYIADLDKAGDK